MEKIQLVLDLTHSYCNPLQKNLNLPNNIKFFTLADKSNNAETQKRLYELVRIGVLDDPGITGSFETFEQFLDNIFVPCYWENAESQFLASINGDWVGLSSISIDSENATAKCGLTVVKKKYRGLGIATELKKKTIEYSLRQGLSRMVTTVHKNNNPMLKVNRKLGFEICN